MFTKGFDIGFKDVDLKQGIVIGGFTYYGNKDLGGDIGEFGMFAKTFKERGPEGKKLIKFLIDHDKTKVPGVIEKLWETPEMPMYQMKAGKHNLGIDFLKMVESDIFNQHSYGYKEVKTVYDQQLKANRLKEVFLYEISAIQFLGMNPETSFIEMKSFDDLLTYLNTVEKFIRTTDCTDETIIKLEEKLKSLHELIKPDKSTLRKNEADKDQIKLVLQNLEKSWKIL